MSVSGPYGAERRYSVPSNPFMHDPRGMQSEDLHAWSIYRQNLNSDFTDSALGSTDKSPLPYGNFQLRDTTVQSILSHPRYGPKNCQTEDASQRRKTYVTICSIISGILKINFYKVATKSIENRNLLHRILDWAWPHERLYSIDKSALGSNMYTYLKFGLPRVFPPNHNGSQRSGTPRPKTSIGSGMKPVPRVSRPSRGIRENSSGYDSSDNETSQQYKYSRKYRSDPDFRMQNVHPSYQSPGIPLVAMHQAGIRAGPDPQSQWTNSRNKSVSEANLLAIESRNYGMRQSYNRRNSVAEFGNDGDHSQIGRPMSKAESHMSINQNRKGHPLPSGMRGDYVDGHAPHTSYIYPNLQVKNLDIASTENSSMLLVSGINCEVKAGEILAIMATAEGEATGLLDVLAGIRKKLSGDIILNGQPVSKTTLRSTTAYVRNNIDMCPDMTVVQTLKFHAQLKWPNSKMSHIKVDSKDRINILIEELGLEQVRLTNVGRLTRSELRRLNVACHMLLDTVVLILDQPTREMDIFDTFFLIEYLRNWASTGRIVIMTLHPPTYEIFAMLTKVVLISAGRTMYSGYRRDLIPYFGSIDYPCPAFKNPSDYYLDLVTLDDLSAAAMLESSGRIEQLAEVFRSTQARVHGEGDSNIPLVPPIPLPSATCTANPIKQSWMLLKKTLLYTQPNSIISWITRLIIAAIFSLISGAIYWDLPSSDSQFTQNDRLGYHYSTMCITAWPLLLLVIVLPIYTKRKYIERDIDIGLYGRTVFILTDSLADVPPSLCVWLAFLIPSYSMTGLYMQGFDNYNGFYLYLGYMILYLCCIKMLVKAVAFLIPPYKLSTYISAVILTILFIGSGYTIQHLDMSVYTRWIEYISPARWVLSVLSQREFSAEAIQSNQIARCKNKQVQRQDIIVQVHCPTPNGTQLLSNVGLVRSNYLWEYADESTLIALVTFWVVSFVVSCMAFIFDCCKHGKKLTQRPGRGNKCTPNTP